MPPFGRRVVTLLFALSQPVLTSPVWSADPETEARIAELERQVQELRRLLSSQSGALQVVTETLDPAEDRRDPVTVEASDLDQIRVAKPGTKLGYGGFIKVDSLFSDYSDGKPSNTLVEDFMVPGLIPVSSGAEGSYNSYQLHAKTTRFYLTTDTATDAGNISSWIEMDFVVGAQGNEVISNSWANRLRQAYIRWDYTEGSSLMAGQAWSTFFNLAAWPSNLDFFGPVGMIFNRQAMVRWTTGPWMVALENPRTRLEGVGSDDFSEGVPDVVVRYNGHSGDLNWALAGLARELTYDNGDREDSRYGYGVSFTGKWLLGADDLRFGLNYGDALGRYMGLGAFADGYVTDGGRLEKNDQLGAFMAYRHALTDRWETGITLSLARADNPDTDSYAAAAILPRRYRTGHLNLKYRPTPQLELGSELVYGSKQLEDGSEGSLNRLQMSVKYGF